MKRMLILLGVILVLNFQGKAQDQQQQQWLVGVDEFTPEFSFTWKGGKADKISNHQGKVVLINFFATWCPPCRQELPRVQQEIWDQYQSREDFALFVFGREEDWDVLDPFIEKTGYTFPILPDLERSIFSKFATQSIPRNVILDRNGKIIYQSIGYSVAEFDKMLMVLEHALNQ